MITVHIFKDKPCRHAFTNDAKGENLPSEGYNEWKFIETKHYLESDKEFSLLPVSANEINDSFSEKGYIILDFTEIKIRLKVEEKEYADKFDLYCMQRQIPEHERNAIEYDIVKKNWQKAWNNYWYALSIVAKENNAAKTPEQ